MARATQKPAAPTFPWSDQLILFRYFLNLFGKSSLAALVGKLNSVEYEGVDENQNTYFWGELDLILQSQGAAAKISRDALRRYDENICHHVGQIGKQRGGLRLKYFQYIACLFTEMYLDRYFEDKAAFADELNAFSETIRTESLGAIDVAPYTPENMNKLAFMCATGSGKTLIMHINILQFQHYLKKAKRLNPHAQINKIIVLSPNEGMSNQHLEELSLSLISAEPFAKGELARTADVIVIDMNKLKEEGKVKTVSVDSFMQNNLVLVDEAHRGLAGGVWYEYRSRLSAEGGFAFEYSATLKQAMKSGKPGNASLAEWKGRQDEYFRSIIMDYSYKYFYEDGYGKEYRIYNLQESILEEQRQLYLVGCLLSFYQQLKLFAERRKTYAPFQIEKPLLVFVGNRVTAKTSAAEMTDVEEVLGFIDYFVNRKDITIPSIETVLYKDPGLKDGAGRELFSQNFNALFTLFGGSPKAEDIYKDMLRLVFNSETASDEPHMQIVNLRQAPGEIALRISPDGAYFGVISIGDTAGLIKNCEHSGLDVRNEEFASESLFRRINTRDSNIHLLIGSRKFTEGWNSWRVSTMGLINFAKGEGSQAIQLFGRGVRLHGYGGYLKRSHRLDDSSISMPQDIELLETLTIFGIKAQYMEEFKKYLEMEDIPANEKPHKYPLPVLNRYNAAEHKKLRVIKLKRGVSFKKQGPRIVLGAPSGGFAGYLSKNKVTIDCRAKVQMIESTFSMQLESVPEEHTIDAAFIRFLDYERILDELESYKNDKNYYNITLSVDGLREVMSVNWWYSLVVPKPYVTIDSLEKLFLVTDFASMALRGYVDRLFRYEKVKFEDKYLEYQELDAEDSNFVDEYTFIYNDGYDGDQTGATIDTFVKDLAALIEASNGIPEAQYEVSALHGILTAFDFRAHLYAPLIHVQAGNLKLSVTPVSLNEDEKRFVDMLRTYVNENSSVFDGKSLYLLRNKSKVGMGFFVAGSFYPDYILWIDTPDVQYISFVDPKGLRHLQWTDSKIEFYATIKNLEKRLQPTSGKRIVLNSFIMSGTRPEDLRQWWGKPLPERRGKNIYCLDEPDCVAAMIAKILSSEVIS